MNLSQNNFGDDDGRNEHGEWGVLAVRTAGENWLLDDRYSDWKDAAREAANMTRGNFNDDIMVYVPINAFAVISQRRLAELAA